MFIRFLESKFTIHRDGSVHKAQVVLRFNEGSHVPRLYNQAGLFPDLPSGCGFKCLARFVLAAWEFPADPAVWVFEFEAKQAVFDTREGVEHCHANARVSTATLSR